MQAATAADPQADGCDLGALDIDAGGIRASGGPNPVAYQEIDDGLLQEPHEAFHTDTGAGQIEQDIGDELPRTMVSDLTTAVGCDDGDTARINDMFRATCLTQGVDRWMLQ